MATPRRNAGTVGCAGDAHQAALALHDRIVARLHCTRSGLAESGNRAVDQPRMPRAQRRVIEAELRQRSRTEVLDDHVALRDQPLEQARALRVLEVERDAFLVAVDAQEIARSRPRGTAGPHAARVVALARLLDLDHARAHVGEQHRAVGTGEDAREVEHGDAVEWRHNGQSDYRLRRQRLTQLRAGERVAFTRRRAVHGLQRRRRRARLRRADRARLADRARDGHRRARAQGLQPRRARATAIAEWRPKP